jgi:protein required for attachment to host cells
MISHTAILVANSFIARLFEQSSLDQPWVETRDWWHAEGRMHARDLERAPLGHSMAGRMGLAPRTDIHQRERAKFAHDLAMDLENSLATDKWHAMEIFASNPFLGELLAHLSPDVKKIVRATHALDWTSLSVADIEKRWRKEFKI